MTADGPPRRRRALRIPGILPEPGQVRVDDRPLDERDEAVLADLHDALDGTVPPPEADAPPQAPGPSRHAVPERPEPGNIPGWLPWTALVLGGLLLVGLAFAGMAGARAGGVEYLAYGVGLVALGALVLRRIKPRG